MAHNPNDRGQEMEREELESDQSPGNEAPVTNRSSERDEASEDVDPDSADSDVDRDDTIDEP